LTFLFDENISQLVVDALKVLGKPVAYLTDILPRGTDDLTLFFRLGELVGFSSLRTRKSRGKNMSWKHCDVQGLEHSFSREEPKEISIP
jgi:hypothetical protein